MGDAVVTEAVQQQRARRARVVAQLRLEAAALEATGALTGAGIRSILLKGASIAHWLYDEPWMRPYGDIDLLVAPEDWGAASQTLTRLGYVDIQPRPVDERSPDHGHHWVRRGANAGQIDLHHRFFWVRGGAREVWEELAAGTEKLHLGRGSVDVLGPAGRLMLVALHAAQHGRRARQPLHDLELALQRVGDADWLEAAALADRLDLGDAFGCGVRLLPAGVGLAERLALRWASSVELRVHAETMRPTAGGIRWMLEQRSWRSRSVRLGHELVPDPDFMRVWHPVARRGRRGLTAAYLWRPLWLAWQAPGATAQLLRAARGVSRATRTPDR